MLRASLAFSSVVLVSAAFAAELTGRVLDAQGTPVVGAIVAVSTAKPRVGPATTCPSCYVDCRRRTLTDDTGRFTIEGLSSKLLFRLAVGGSEYQGFLTDHYDPAESPEIDLRLESLPDAPEISRATGTVVDLDGKPIAFAEVSSHVIQRGNVFEDTDVTVSPITLTDTEGQYVITAGKHIDSIQFRVQAPGYAINQVTWRRGEETPKVALGRGASLRGRLMLNGDPLKSVELGLVQKNRFVPNLVTPAEVSTDEEGYFQFDQLPPDCDYTLYTHTGQNAKGVLPVSLVRVPGHAQRADLGEIPAQIPTRLSIRVVSEDGSPIPEKSTVAVGRMDAWWGTTLNLARAPSAEVVIDDASHEVFYVVVNVPGYQVVHTRPHLNKDLNERFVFEITKDTQVSLVVRRLGAEEPPKVKS